MSYYIFTVVSYVLILRNKLPFLF